MPRVWPGGRAGQHQQPKQQQKRRRFFSANHLPPLQLALPTPAPRAVASDRVLAALQTDERAVVAAKNFVKENMAEDTWNPVEAKLVTRDAIEVAVANGALASKRQESSAVVSRPPPTSPKTTKTTPLQASPRKAPAAKVGSKRLAIGSTKQTIAQRIKAKGAQVARKVSLRSHAPPKPPSPVPSSSKLPPPPIAAPSNARVRQLIASESRSVSHSSNSTSNVSNASNASASTSKSVQSVDSMEIDDDVHVAAPEVPFEPNPGKRKEFLQSGLYCQDEDPPAERMLVNRVLEYRAAQPPKKRGPGRPRKSVPAASNLPPIPTPEGQPVSFPPLPLEFHYDVFFGGEEREFQLPFNIMWESETGALDGKKRPPFYQKIRTNHFVERNKYMEYGERAVCNCDPEYGCGDNCINFIMSYLCGTECPCGDHCGNKSLARRKGKATKVAWTGSRGFGLFAAEDIKEGDFVADYRGEVIHINTFIERINSTYQGKRNFYALAYDRDEVIDAGLRGNDTRFINHGCNPNLEVRKYGTLGDGYDEYEVGMWAKKDIKAGEEMFYNYNFDSFAVMVNKDDGRQKCMCGAPNCVGFLGRKQGEKSAKELAADIAATAAAAAASSAGKGKSRASTSTPALTSVGASSPASTPRPRGRPPKSGTASVPTPSPAPEPTPGKRPVGRPRKHPLIDSGLSSTPEAKVEPAAKGRPKVVPKATPKATPKAPAAAPAAPAAGPSTNPFQPVKRGRGRPPKPKPIEGKRPRGRPRVHPLPDPSVPVIKRPRGRPRLSAPELTTPATTSPAAPEPLPTGAVRARRSTSRSAPYTIPERARAVSQSVGAALGAAAQSVGSLKLKFTVPGFGNATASGSGTQDEPVKTEPQLTAKQAEKSRRNGAPAGWAYLPVGVPVKEEEEEVSTSSRAARLAARRGE